MATLRRTLAYQRLASESTALRLLRADHAAVIAAVLEAHLGSPGAKIQADELHELIDAELETLRDYFELPKTARAYCDDWRHAGFLIRRPAAGSREETYELSAETYVAIRVFAQLDQPRTTLTQSRLINLAQSIRQLAVDTDPEAEGRLVALQAELTRLTDEIERTKSGDYTVLDERTPASASTKSCSRHRTSPPTLPQSAPASSDLTRNYAPECLTLTRRSSRFWIRSSVGLT